MRTSIWPLAWGGKMATLAERTQINLDARADADVFATAETPGKNPPTQDRNPAIPNATLNGIIMKLRRGRSNIWIKHHTTNPAGKAPTLAQIQTVRELWAAEVVERTPDPEL